MPLRSLSSRLRRTLFALVLLALVLAQTLALVHRIVHAGTAADAAATVAVPDAAATVADADGLRALFAGHRGAHGCELYDQLHHADPIRAAVVTVAVPPRDDLREARQATALVATAPAAPRARGPPRTV